MKREYDPNRGGIPFGNGIDGEAIQKLSNIYTDMLDENKGIVDEAKTTIVWLNNRGLFDRERVKEFLDEQSNIGGETDG